MQHAQSCFEGRQRIAPMRIQAGVFLESQLLELDVPVAEFMPEEAPQDLCGFVETILRYSGVSLFGAGVQPAENPAVLKRDRHRFRIGLRLVRRAWIGRPRLDAGSAHIQEEES